MLAAFTRIMRCERGSRCTWWIENLFDTATTQKLDTNSDQTVYIYEQEGKEETIKLPTPNINRSYPTISSPSSYDSILCLILPFAFALVLQHPKHNSYDSSSCSHDPKYNPNYIFRL